MAVASEIVIKENDCGYYTPYEGKMICYENRLWISDRMLVKVIDDLLNDKLNMIPRVTKSSMAEINKPFRSPFNENKRFPEVGKYCRLDPNLFTSMSENWYALFSGVVFDLNNISVKEHNHNIAEQMMIKLSKNEGMINRDSFERGNGIQWHSNNQIILQDNGYYKPYEGALCLFEKQIWLSDKMVARFINDKMDNNNTKFPNFNLLTTTIENIPYLAPFAETKRFPAKGKYIRVGPDNTYWKNLKTWSIYQLESQLESEDGMVNRLQFENEMKIKWIASPLVDTKSEIFINSNRKDKLSDTNSDDLE